MFKTEDRNAFPDPWERLAVAITLQAVADYRHLAKTPRFEDDFEYEVRTGKLAEVERFFLSDYGELVCLGMGTWILERLKNER